MPIRTKRVEYQGERDDDNGEKYYRTVKKKLNWPVIWGSIIASLIVAFFMGKEVLGYKLVRDEQANSSISIPEHMQDVQKIAKCIDDNKQAIDHLDRDFKAHVKLAEKTLNLELRNINTKYENINEKFRSIDEKLNTLLKQRN